MTLRARHAVLPAVLILAGCPQAANPGDGGRVRTDGGPLPLYCSLGNDVNGATVLAGFCMRTFAQIGSPRALAVAPNGDLFVAAPSNYAPGGSGDGAGAVLLLTDDDLDGTAEVHTFVDNVPDVHGIALGGGYLYFSTQNSVFRVAYVDGQRVANGAPEDLQLGAEFGSGGRWTHGVARSTGGHLFASRGQYATCGGTPGGSIYELGTHAMSVVATGFRNPMYMRCHFRDDVCMASELGEDQTTGAHEKLLYIRSGTDFGYPCCFGNGASSGGSDCSMITQEDESIPLSDTPFGLDWERGQWSGDFAGGLFVALHGSFYSQPVYRGASVVYFQTDPTTHRPTGSFAEFIGGWGHVNPNTNPPSHTAMSRPADVAFSPDGRMFIADDTGNYVYWVAPTTLQAGTH